jgi:hypothetical protein
VSYISLRKLPQSKQSTVQPDKQQWPTKEYREPDEVNNNDVTNNVNFESALLVSAINAI